MRSSTLPIGSPAASSTGRPMAWLRYSMDATSRAGPSRRGGATRAEGRGQPSDGGADGEPDGRGARGAASDWDRRPRGVLTSRCEAGRTWSAGGSRRGRSVAPGLFHGQRRDLLPIPGQDRWRHLGAAPGCHHRVVRALEVTRETAEEVEPLPVRLPPEDSDHPDEFPTDVGLDLARRLDAVLEIAGRLAASHDREELFRMIVDETRRTLRADATTIRILRGDHLEVTAWAGMSDDVAASPARLPAATKAGPERSSGPAASSRLVGHRHGSWTWLRALRRRVRLHRACSWPH